MNKHRTGMISFVAVLLLMTACGKDTRIAGPTDGASPQPLGKPAAKMVGIQRTVVTATVTQNGAPVAGVEVAFARSVSGRSSVFHWTGTTGANGVAEIAIAATGEEEIVGYYLVKATDPASGDVMGQWHSVPINRTKDVALSLPVGQPSQITSQVPLVLSAQELQTLLDLSGRDLNRHDLDRWVMALTNDMVFDLAPLPVPLAGKDQVKAYFGAVFQAFPDFQTTPGLRLFAGNILVEEHPFVGTHSADWLGVPATGNKIVGPHIDILEYEGDKVRRITTYLDNISALVQMGAVLAPDLSGVAPSFAPPPTEPTNLTPVEAMLESITRFNSHDLQNYARMFNHDADIMVNGAPIDVITYFGISEKVFIAAHSDLHLEVVRNLDMGDGWVVTEVTVTGTDDGGHELLGFPATGRPIDFRLGLIARFDTEGQVSYLHFYYDQLTEFVQLGLIQAP